MATDTEALVLQMSAELKQFQNQMLRAAGEADRAAQRIQRSFEKANQKLVNDLNRFGNQVRTVLAVIGVGAVARDVVELGDAWTRVGNRLGAAGVEAQALAAAQQVVADIAVRTNSDLEATADLFSRMYRSSQDLGASMGDIAAVTELVSKALSGADQSERAGAIRQLGQGLGSGRLQGDELRSILENSRPIAEAIAREFDVAVGELRRLGAAGELESRRVFDAIINAAPEIEAAFARTIPTVADAWTNLRTQVTRYVGTTSETSSASRSLASVIKFTADNFEALANAAVVAATVIGGTLAGAALGHLLRGLQAVTTSATAARAAMNFLGGPVGITIGVAASAMGLLAANTNLFASASQAAATANDTLWSGLNVLANLELVDEEEVGKIARLADETTRTSEATGELANVLDRAADNLEAFGTEAGKGLGDLSTRERLTRAMAQAQLEQARATLLQARAAQQARLDTLNRDEFFAGFASAFTPDDVELQRIQERARQAQEIRALIADFDDGIAAVDSGRVQLREGAGDAPGGTGSGTGAGAAGARRTAEDLERAAELNMARLRDDLARVDALQDAAEIEERTARYVQARIPLLEAEARAQSEVAAEREIINQRARDAYELQLLQDRVDIARIENNVALADQLSDQLEIARRTEEIKERLRVSEAEAASLAREYVEARREALNIDREHNLELRDLQNELELARARGDERAERAISRRLELEGRIAELRREGVSESAAIDRAQAEIAALERADLQGKFRDWFRNGVTAALEGDFSDFFQNWLRDRAATALENALDSIADSLFDTASGLLGQVMQTGPDGYGQAVSAVADAAGFDQLGAGATEAADALGGVLSAAAGDAAAKIGLQAAGVAQEIVATSTGAVALNQLTKAAIGAAAALQTVGSGGGAGKDFASIVLKSLSYGGGKASGGGVRPGNWYMVGENGPEPFVPTAPGVVIPNGALEGLKLLGELPRFTPPPASPSVKVNVVNQSGVNVDASVRPSADGVGFDVLLTRQTENALRSGRHDGALRDRWGLTPPRTRRS